jgi:hypothetical protein
MAMNGGVPVDYAWGNDIDLGDTADSIGLLNEVGDVIDEVVYDTSAGWPSTIGASMNLAGAFWNDIANDSALAWCSASSTGGPFGLGTPGTLNDSCSP